MIYWKWLIVTGISLLISATAGANETTRWRALAPGLEYTQLTGFSNFPQGRLHAFRVDLHRYQLKSVLMPNDEQRPADKFQQLMRAQQAVIASNGGFFTPQLKPLGLRISQGQLFSSFKPVSWWGVLMIQQQQAHLVTSPNYRPEPGVDFAIQAGPLLVMSGQVMPRLSTKLEVRTALGITANHQVILLATQDMLLSTADLAALIARSAQQGGLECAAAVNLDGGSSTQLYAHVADFSLTLESGSHVADALLVVPVEE